jgi:type IV fimbrial biogenesis protein FimT
MLIRKDRGFSLIELMVTLTLLGILLAAAVPEFATWTANARVRSVAESVQNGLRLAQTEAVRRNRQTVFGLTNATPAAGATSATDGSNWFIQTLPLVAGDPVAFIQGGTFAKQSGVSIAGGALICFNSTGRQVSNAATGLGADCTPPASATAPTVLDITKAGSDRPMRIQVSLGGQIRMCDPAKSIASQPDGC